MGSRGPSEERYHSVNAHRLPYKSLDLILYILSLAGEVFKMSTKDQKGRHLDDLLILEDEGTSNLLSLREGSRNLVKREG